jgi:hypothetical protein
MRAIRDGNAQIWGFLPGGASIVTHQPLVKTAVDNPEDSAT